MSIPFDVRGHEVLGSLHRVCFSASAERSTGSPAVPVVPGGRDGRRSHAKQPEGRQHQRKDGRSVPAPLHPSPQTAVAL